MTTSSKQFYLDTSAVLRAVVETGTSSDIESALASAQLLLTSRLSKVESSRVFHRLRLEGKHSETQLADLEEEVESIWVRSEIWELTSNVCNFAARIAPKKALRTIDAIHLATYQLARRRIPDLQMLSADERLTASM